MPVSPAGIPWTTRRGDDDRVSPTSAWTLDEQRPAALDDGGDDGAGDSKMTIRQQHGTRVHKTDETGLGHLEEPDLPGGAVAVLGGAQVPK